MSASQPREITTTQQGVHDKLDALVTRYQQSENRRPVSEHTRQTFEQATGWLDGWQGDIILTRVAVWVKVLPVWQPAIPMPV